MATEAVKRSPLQLQQQMPQPPPSTEMGNPLWKTVLVASIAAGVQFGWALQLSLLTPYIQHLGISHTLSSLIWLCGPVSGLLVQPLVGYYSDHCTSRFGRRSPFIAAGAGCVAVAVILIGYAADIGHLAGDSLTERLKLRAIVVFVVGFWILDVANNMLQGPCRAFLADLSANDPKKTRVANAVFSFFMAVGNILGYAAGSVGTLHKRLPFTNTKACDDYCANLKTCFFISIALLLTLTTVALTCVREKQWSPDQDSAANANRGNDAVQRQITPVAAAPAAETGRQSKGRLPFFRDMFHAFKNLERPMWWLLFVTCLNWIGWFPFVLFDTDWMGKEVYGGKSNAAEGTPELKMYNMGVQKGALGLMFNSVVLGFTSLGVEVLARSVGGVNRLWGIMNFVLAAGLSMMVVITKLAESQRLPNGYPSRSVRAGALTVFAVLGVPQAITFSIPFALACILSTTIGQGLSLGVLNISIVVPQMVISLVSGPFDSLFGGGNSPAFVVGAIAAAASGIVALTKLPSPPPDIKTLSAPAHH